jgi:hypothetical protein
MFLWQVAFCGDLRVIPKTSAPEVALATYRVLYRDAKGAGGPGGSEDFGLRFKDERLTTVIRWSSVVRIDLGEPTPDGRVVAEIRLRNGKVRSVLLDDGELVGEGELGVSRIALSAVKQLVLDSATGQIMGVLVDADTRQPVAGAELGILIEKEAPTTEGGFPYEDLNLPAKTSTSGEFRFRGLPAGKYVIAMLHKPAAAGWPTATFVQNDNHAMLVFILKEGQSRDLKVVWVKSRP